MQLVFLCMLVAYAAAKDCLTKVEIDQGALCGKFWTDLDGGKFYSFQGIPYAKPPIGELRFKAPQPAEKWAGVHDATVEGSECYSHHMLQNYVVGSEDCLFLNVFTKSLPNKENEKLKPVMFWIHGGGFVTGSSKSELYGPEFLMTEDIVLVTVNYRLGFLGFLALEDQTLGVPGNAAMKDLVLALKWVQTNIKAFGGNPDEVTIFGESAGAAAVHFLMLSPMANGLFQRAIAQSGCAINTWAQGQTNSKNFAEKLGITFMDEEDLLKKMITLPLDQLLAAQDKLENMHKVSFDSNEQRFFAPVIERQTNEPAFLPDDPVALMKSGNFTKVPFLTGFNSREGFFIELAFMSEVVKPEERLNYDFQIFVPHNLGVKRNSALALKLAAKIKEFYADNLTISEETIDKDYVIRTDVLSLRGSYSSVKWQFAQGQSPIYFYRLSLDNKLNLFKHLINITLPGASHGDDLPFLFKTSMSPAFEPGSEEDKAVRKMVKLWTNFAKYGNPNPKEADELLNVEWKPIKEGEFNFLDIGSTLTAGVEPESARMAFWDNLVQSDPSILDY